MHLWSKNVPSNKKNSFRGINSKEVANDRHKDIFIKLIINMPELKTDNLNAQ